MPARTISKHQFEVIINDTGLMFTTYSYQSALKHFDKHVTRSMAKVTDTERFPVRIEADGQVIRTYKPGGEDTRFIRPKVKTSRLHGGEALSRRLEKEKARQMAEHLRAVNRKRKATEAREILARKLAMTKAEQRRLILADQLAKAKAKERRAAEREVWARGGSTIEMIQAGDKAASKVTLGNLIVE